MPTIALGAEALARMVVPVVTSSDGTMVSA
jgi:hypothetical protein